MDDSFKFPAQLLKSLQVHKDYAEVLTIRNKSAFEFALNKWKTNTLFSQHTPLPPDQIGEKPAPYMIVTIDEAKHLQRFTEYWNSGQGQLNYDFYVSTPANLPASTWDLTPANTPTPTNEANPVGPHYAGFGPGVYEHLGGQDWNDRAPYFDVAAGKFYKLYRIRDNPWHEGFKNFAWVEVGVGEIPKTTLYAPDLQG